MAVVEVGALHHSSSLPLSQIHRKGRYIHLLRTGRKHERLENTVVCPLFKERKRYPLNLLHLKAVSQTPSVLHPILILIRTTTREKRITNSIIAILPSSINSTHLDRTIPKTLCEDLQVPETEALRMLSNQF